MLALRVYGIVALPRPEHRSALGCVAGKIRRTGQIGRGRERGKESKGRCHGRTQARARDTTPIPPACASEMSILQVSQRNCERKTGSKNPVSTKADASSDVESVATHDITVVVSFVGRMMKAFLKEMADAHVASLRESKWHTFQSQLVKNSSLALLGNVTFLNGVAVRDTTIGSRKTEAIPTNVIVLVRVYSTRKLLDGTGCLDQVCLQMTKGLTFHRRLTQ